MFGISPFGPVDPVTYQGCKRLSLALTDQPLSHPLSQPPLPSFLFCVELTLPSQPRFAQWTRAANMPKGRDALVLEFKATLDSTRDHIENGKPADMEELERTNMRTKTFEDGEK